MASKVAVASSHDDSSVIVSVDQAFVVNDADGKVELRLLGVDVKPLDFDKVRGLLQELGLPKRETFVYAEDIVELVMRREFARLLADRVTRVG
jgi:hypothetical protein